MRKNIKIFLLLVAVVLASFLFFIKFALPNVGELEYISIKPSESRLERGKYLATNVCVDCHSTRNWNEFSGPLVMVHLVKVARFLIKGLDFREVFILKTLHLLELVIGVMQKF